MAVITSNASGNYGTGATWVGGIVPVEGDSVVIALGHTVTVDGTYIAGDDTVTAFTVNGTLSFSRLVNSSLQIKGNILTAGAITANIDMGTVASPIPAGVNATLILNYSASMANFKYGLTINDLANFTAVGATKNINTVLNSTITAGATSMVVEDCTGWRVGDTVVIAESDGNLAHEDIKTITGIVLGSGTTGTISWTGGTTYDHLAGVPVGNFTSNVTIKNFDTTTMAYICTKSGTNTAVNGRRAMAYVSMQYVGSDINNPSTKCYIYSSSYTSNVIPYERIESVSWFGSNNSATTQMVIFNYSAGGIMNNCASYSNQTGASIAIYLGSASFMTINNFVSYRYAFGCVFSGFGAGGSGSIFNNCKFWAGKAYPIQLQSSSSNIFNNCKLHTLEANNPYIRPEQGSATFNNCSFGGSDLPGSKIATYISENSAGRLCNITFTDCRFYSGVTTFALNQTAGNPGWISTLINKNTLVTSQEIYSTNGNIFRDNGFFLRGVSSQKFSLLKSNSTYGRTYSVFAQNNVERTIIGYIYYDTNYTNTTPPSITLSGLGITPVTFTAGSTINTWYKFTLTATQTSGNDGNLTLAVSGSSPNTTGSFWVDGIIDPPFVTSVRHYGYLFDANIYRTVNPYIAVTTEATVGAYTGISINHGTKTITITGTLSSTQIRDYIYYDLCQTANLGIAEYITNNPSGYDIGTYSMVNSGAITGALTISTTGTYTGAGTYGSNQINASNGSFTNILVSGLVANSRVRVDNTTDNIELYNAVIAGTSVSIPVTWTTNKSLDLRVTNVIGTTGYLPFQSAGTLTSSGASFTVSQTPDTVYNSNGIDGSTVTECVADYPNIQIDLNDLDGVTSYQRIYAWFQWATHGSQGIIYFFNGITATDVANYKVNTSIVNLKLDNVSPSSLPIKISGGYLYRDDNATIIYSGSKSIQLDPGKTYVSNGGLTQAQSDRLFSLPTSVGGVGMSNNNVLKKIDDAKKEILEKIDTLPTEIPELSLDPLEKKLNEIDSHNLLATSEIIDTIKQTEIEICGDIVRKTKEIKEDNVTTRQLIRQKTEKVVKYAEKQLDRQDKIEKMIEDEAEEIESEIERIINEEADMIENEIYNKEADQIESENNSNQSNDGN